MSEVLEQDFLAEIAREVVARAAPHELPLYRSVSTAYFAAPESAATRKAAKDEMLAFGVGEALAMLTPAVLAITKEVLVFLIEQIKKTAKDESAAAIKKVVKRLFKKAVTEEAACAVLTPDQLVRVREVTLAKARLLNLPEAQAMLIADAMIGSLALPSLK